MTSSIVNGTLRTDPTRTQSIRKAFEADMVGRFVQIKRAMVDAIVTKDVFGIRSALKANLESEQFAFLQSDQKVSQFMSWLAEQQKASLLTYWSNAKATENDAPWTNVYVKRAYQSAMSQAEGALIKSGHKPFSLAGKGSSVVAAFNQPFHADRVAMLYTRTYEDLKTVANVMDSKIRNALIDGLTNVLPLGMVVGKSPLVVAKEVAALATGPVDTIGIVRGQLIARTEIIRAHHQATINEYEKWGVQGVTVDAEWLTAGFNVCDECDSMSGKEFSLEQIRSMIPAHPNCRCCAIPVIKKEEGVKAPPAPPVPTFTDEQLNDSLKTLVFGSNDVLAEDASINGIALKDFDMSLQYSDFGTKELPYEPVLDTTKDIRAGVIIVEPDGRLWMNSKVADIDFPISKSVPGHDGDKYGKTIGDFVRKNRFGDPKDLMTKVVDSSSNETIFKNSLSIFDNLSKIVVENSSEREAVLKVFKKHGVLSIRGRSIEDIIIVS
jgi:hypothetical protein